MQGAGKSTYANKLKNQNPSFIIVSTDVLRKELLNNINDRKHNDFIYQEAYKRINDNLKNGYNVIFDATNINRKSRSKLLNSIPRFADTECHVVWDIVENCIDKDNKRERTVGQSVIEKTLKKFEPPFIDEGFSKILVHISSSIDSEDYMDQYIVKNMDLKDEKKISYIDYALNALSILEKEHSDKEELFFPIGIYNIGRPNALLFFKETNFHQNVGAWLSYGLKDHDPFVAWIIGNQTAMFDDSKYFKKLPNFLKDDLIIFQEIIQKSKRR